MAARPGDLPLPVQLLLAFALALLTTLPPQPCAAQQQPPSPGYYPSAALRSLAFSEAYRTLWGPQHQTLSPDGRSLTLWMDRSSGSGFKSARAYRSGYFGASVRVQPGYTAGVNTAFYVSEIFYVLHNCIVAVGLHSAETMWR
jgi:xyloglucan:xyloglucosyl transferase